MFPYNAPASEQPPDWTQGVALFQQNLNPYDSEKFLNEVFNFNYQSIQAFQTLSHQLKLKFYLSVQQMKLMGYMSDKAGYQSILQEIARRAMIIKKPSAPATQKKEQDIWGVKLENLCDGHLKKLQHDTFLDSFPTQFQQSNTQFNINSLDFLGTTSHVQKKVQQQQFEWAQPVQQSEQNTKAKQFHNINPTVGKSFEQIMPAYNSSKIFQNSTQSINNVEQLCKSQNNIGKNNENAGKLSTPQSLNINHNQLDLSYLNSASASGYGNNTASSQNNFGGWSASQSYNNTSLNNVDIFSNQLLNNSAKVENQKMTHIDVWDLEVIEDEPQNLKKKSSIKSNKSAERSGAVANSSNQTLDHVQRSNSYNPMLNQYEAQYNSNYTFDHGFEKNKQKQPISMSSSAVYSTTSANYTQASHTVSNYGQPYSVDPFDGFYQPKKNSTQVQSTPIATELVNNHVPTNKQQDDQFQWQQGTQVVANNPLPMGQYNVNQEQLNHIKIAQPYTVNVSPQPTTIQKNNFDFDFLQPIKSKQVVQPQTSQISQLITYQPKNFINSINHNAVEAPGYTVQLETSFGIDLTSLENTGYLGANQNTMSMQKSGIFMKKQQDQDQQYEAQPDQNFENSMLSPAIMPSVNTKILQPLKCFPKTSAIIQILKKKIFDFDRSFYQDSLTLIEDLGYEQNPDYGYIKQQSHICQQIFRLTEQFTAAVDQQKQEQLRQNLKKCKQLYKQLDSSKTAATIRKYVKLGQFTLSYQIGRLSLQAGVPNELIQKAVKLKNKNRKQFNMISTLLYLMEYFGSTYSINLFATQVAQYIEHIHKQMVQFAQLVSETTKQCKAIIRKSDKFIEYRNNLGRIAHISKRILEINHYCTKDEQYLAQLEPISEKLTQMETKDFSFEQKMLPTYFLTFFADFACGKNNNVYTLHEKMSEFIQLHPICSICLRPIENQEDHRMGTKKEDGKYYHYCCWNFKVQVVGFKNKLMMADAPSAEHVQNVQQKNQPNEQKVQVSNGQQLVIQQQDEWVDSQVSVE